MRHGINYATTERDTTIPLSMKIIVNEGGTSSLLSCFYLSFRKVNCVRKARLGIIRTLVSNECRRLRGAEFLARKASRINVHKCSFFE